MSKMTIKPLGHALGARITGIDLAGRVDDATMEVIRQARREHLVLCFPGQDLSIKEQVAFCSRFGNLEREKNMDGVRHPDFPEIYMLVNKPVEIKAKRIFATKADTWHWDGAYFERPAMGTFLLAKELPEIGGDTLFANMYLAYDTLSPTFKRMIEPLQAVHVRARSRNNLIPGSPEALEIQSTPPCVHSLVGAHPETGRKSLLLGDRIRNIVGMTEEETRPLVDFLIEHATRDEYCYRHRWSLHDLVLWDNLAAQHRGLLDYEAGQPRVMHRCVQLGPRIGHAHAD